MNEDFEPRIEDLLAALQDMERRTRIIKDYLVQIEHISTPLPAPPPGAIIGKKCQELAEEVTNPKLVAALQDVERRMRIIREYLMEQHNIPGRLPLAPLNFIIAKKCKVQSIEWER